MVECDIYNIQSHSISRSKSVAKFEINSVGKPRKGLEGIRYYKQIMRSSTVGICEIMYVDKIMHSIF